MIGFGDDDFFAIELVKRDHSRLRKDFPHVNASVWDAGMGVKELRTALAAAIVRSANDLTAGVENATAWHEASVLVLL